MKVCACTLSANLQDLPRPLCDILGSFVGAQPSGGAQTARRLSGGRERALRALLARLAGQAHVARSAGAALPCTVIGRCLCRGQCCWASTHRARLVWFVAYIASFAVLSVAAGVSPFPTGRAVAIVATLFVLTLLAACASLLSGEETAVVVDGVLSSRAHRTRSFPNPPGMPAGRTVGARCLLGLIVIRPLEAGLARVPRRAPAEFPRGARVTAQCLRCADDGVCPVIDLNKPRSAPSAPRCRAIFVGVVPPSTVRAA